MVRAIVKRRRLFGPAVLVLSLAALAGCEEGKGPSFLQAKDKTETATSGKKGNSKTIEKDVEAPEVFEASEAGLWDGRPSLGGVWVAHPDATDPERVIVTNTSNSKSVVGALFRRERDIPGPRLQVSSDAAETLGMLAGAPVELSVIALRKEVIEPEPVIEEEEITEVETVEVTDEITATELDPIAGAAAAIEAAPEPTAPAAPAATSGSSYVQIGIFSVKANANRAADQMRSAGMVPEVLEESASGKTFWRVVVGPATKSERTALLNKVKETGFSDAYIVKR